MRELMLSLVRRAGVDSATTELSPLKQLYDTLQHLAVHPGKHYRRDHTRTWLDDRRGTISFYLSTLYSRNMLEVWSICSHLTMREYVLLSALSNVFLFLTRSSASTHEMTD